MKSFLLPTLDDPWRDWKINPVGNAVALMGIVGYVMVVILAVFFP